jgi:hypothetical protein
VGTFADVVGEFQGAFDAAARCQHMQPNVNAIERAFELARSGGCVSLKEIRAHLRAEGYLQDLIVGRYLSAQLRLRESNPKSYES